MMKKQPEPEVLATTLTGRFGIALKGRRQKDSDGVHFYFRPEDLHENEGFAISTTVGWRSMHSRLEIGRFGAEILNEMAHSTSKQREVFMSVARSLLEEGGEIRFRINGSRFAPLSPEEWPGMWDSLELNVQRTPLMLDHDDSEAISREVLLWAGGLIGMIVSLLPVEELEPKIDQELEGLPEGAIQRVEVNKYERSSFNRAMCISVHGTTCKVCDFDFEERYGEIGRDFIHVHHVVPVSQLGADYRIDPARDLVPVCPNCHAMLHRSNLPLTVGELQTLLSSGEGKTS